MLHLIFNQIMSPVLAFVFYPHPLPKQDFKDMCLFIVILKEAFYPFEIVLRIGACLRDCLRERQSCLKGTS